MTFEDVVKDMLGYREFRIKYSLGKSKDVHQLIILAPNMFVAREKVLEKHRNGQLYPTIFSAYQDIKIKAIDDVS